MRAWSSLRRPVSDTAPEPSTIALFLSTRRRPGPAEICAVAAGSEASRELNQAVDGARPAIASEWDRPNRSASPTKLSKLLSPDPGACAGVFFSAAGYSQTRGGLFGILQLAVATDQGIG